MQETQYIILYIDIYFYSNEMVYANISIDTHYTKGQKKVNHPKGEKFEFIHCNFCFYMILQDNFHQPWFQG